MEPKTNDHKIARIRNMIFKISPTRPKILPILARLNEPCLYCPGAASKAAIAFLPLPIAIMAKTRQTIFKTKPANGIKKYQHNTNEIIPNTKAITAPGTGGNRFDCGCVFVFCSSIILFFKVNIYYKENNFYAFN